MYNKQNNVEQLREIEEKRFQIIKELDDNPFLGYKNIADAYDDYKITSNVEVLGRMLNKENLFISGPAGSGKTTIINKFMDIIDAESHGNVNVALTASTGIAAQLIGGQTIHSWSGLGFMTDTFDPKNLNKYIFPRLADLRSVDVLIIDEISMLPAYFFSNLNSLLKWAKRNKEPFGGIQLILTGDFQQLPPVDKDKQLNNNYAITTSDWKEANFNYCYMDKLHRATDKKLRYVLESISRGKITEKTRALINTRMSYNIDNEENNKIFTTLYTTNSNVDKFNKEKLDSLPGELIKLRAIERGEHKNIEKIYKNNNVVKDLELKKDAIVMLTTNLSPSLPNGSIGKVTEISKGLVGVKFKNGQNTYIPRQFYKFEQEKVVFDNKLQKEIKFKEVVASLQQFPLKCAWAITVHKSQGQLFDSVHTDLSNCFTEGLGYVALSRVRSLDDLVITGFSEDAYKINEKARKITTFVKKKAMNDRKLFQENEEEYTSLLGYSIYRQMTWGIENTTN